MPYNKENYARIRADFDKKKSIAEENARRRLDELHAKYPDLCQIDAALAETGMRVFRETLAGKEKLDERLAAIRQENRELQEARSHWFAYHGYPADYTDVHYECPICKDTGTVGTHLCVCMKKALIYAGYGSSGIGGLIKTQSFETFDTSYYASDPKAYQNITRTLAYCRDYAAHFEASDRNNLLLRGDTGLGKTHLSTAIAKVVIERGFDVVYDTAQNIFGDFEYERFGRGYNGGENDRTRRYFDCDLLIFDDLGTEVANQFTVACLYNVINTRLNNNRAMIINTNLSWEELRRRYADRITSRMFGEFMLFELFGRDIRQQKLKDSKR